MTLVCDLEESTVEYTGEDRKETGLAPYFDAFPKYPTAVTHTIDR